MKKIFILAAAALRAANSELRKQVESCRNNAGRIDGYWRKAQDEAMVNEMEWKDCMKKLVSK